MTSEDIRKVTFEKGMRGYRPEDVDDFLLQVAKELDNLSAQLEEAVEEKDEAQNKLYILAEKVEEYRGQEDTLKTALINAQRMGETVVHEAKQKADAMVREATGKAQLLRERAEAEIMGEQQALEKMRDEVTRFKATILNLYKQHIESLSALDSPVEHVQDFLAENSRTPSAAAEAEDYIEAEETASTSLAEDAPEETLSEDAAEYGEDMTPPPRGAADLFEGVPVEEE